MDTGGMVTAERISFWMRSRSAGSVTSLVRRRYSAQAGPVALATSPETNAATKVTMTTPPFCGSRRRISSGTLRGESATARALEWEKMTGASATRRASSMVSGAVWERSTSMPSRFISRTTSSPKRVRPPWRTASLQESAQSRVTLWVRVM
jgi:hypothetical protein